MSASERRTAPRIAERLRLAVTEDGNVLEAETKNISVSGAYCMMSRFIAPMTKLNIQLDIPNGPRHATVKCTGVVVRAEPAVSSTGQGFFHLAIFFSDISPRDRETIAQFVRQRLVAASTRQP